MANMISKMVRDHEEVHKEKPVILIRSDVYQELVRQNRFIANFGRQWKMHGCSWKIVKKTCSEFGIDLKARVDPVANKDMDGGIVKFNLAYSSLECWS